MSNYIKIVIAETGANRPQDQHTMFNETILYAPDMPSAYKELEKHYGKMPGMRRKVYQDYREPGDPEGTFPRTRVCGFLHSFWADDISHPGPKWHQTDWVSFREIQETTPKL